MQAYFPLENNKHNILNFRHCFIAFAKVEKKEDSILNLKQVKTYGYGANPDPHEYMKTGDAYQEPGLADKVVSCVPVFESSKLSDSSEIYIKWAVIMQAITSKGWGSFGGKLLET